MEASEQYFDLPEPELHLPASFMLLVVPVHEDKQEIIPAVSHLGTARIQTVSKEWNPLYHQLIKGFGDTSGVPVLLNTSFNVRGEPIVNSPTDAVNTFLESGIDSLVIGNFIVDKS
jgi:carbamoyltransferase